MELVAFISGVCVNIHWEGRNVQYLTDFIHSGSFNKIHYLQDIYFSFQKNAKFCMNIFQNGRR